MSGKPLDDYIDVAERIAIFYDRYPDGRLEREGSFQTVTLGDKTFVVCEAAAYRTADDPHPGRGIAWEPFPGPTPFTRDSELMNAETSAWGRAIAACGIEVKRGIATRQDVQNRRGDGSSLRQSPPGGQSRSPSPQGAGQSTPMTDKQKNYVESLLKRGQFSPDDIAAIRKRFGVEDLKDVPRGSESDVLFSILKREVAIPGTQSDVAADTEGLSHDTALAVAGEGDDPF